MTIVSSDGDFEFGRGPVTAWLDFERCPADALIMIDRPSSTQAGFDTGARFSMLPVVPKVQVRDIALVLDETDPVAGQVSAATLFVAYGAGVDYRFVLLVTDGQIAGGARRCPPRLSALYRAGVV